MGIKSTQNISRENAIAILLKEIPDLSNDALGIVLDALADTKQSKIVSYFDNFFVSDDHPESIDWKGEILCHSKP
jgi:hypothetical protein